MILTFVQIGMRLMEVDPGFVLELIPTSKLPSTDALALLKLSIITSILFCLQFVLELYRTQLPSLHLLPALVLISNWIQKILTLYDPGGLKNAPLIGFTLTPEKINGKSG